MASQAVGQQFDPWTVALKIHELAEVGSSEFKSAELLKQVLKSGGFSVVDGYQGIPTSFWAEKTVGKGGPTIAFLAEYDALLGIGHACGHNLIASAAVFSAIEASKKIRDGRIVVIGTPDEEGTGQYSGSKIIIANKGGFKGIDLVLGSHPSSEWSVGKNSLAVQDVEVVFHGTAAHASASPEKGKSALDAAILTFTAVDMMRKHLKRDANPVIHGVLREGGQASNVTPDRAVLVYGIRSSDLGYHAELLEKFRKIVEGCSMATGTTYDLKLIGPLFTTGRVNRPLANNIRQRLVDRGVDMPTVEESERTLAKGSTDFANVSQVAPAQELSFQIAPKGTPWHSKLSLEAAVSGEAKKMLEVVIEVLSDTAEEFASNESLRKSIAEDFSRKE